MGCRDNFSPKDNLSPKDNVSPKLQQMIDNQNGKIDRIESNQNAIRLAVERKTENHNSGVQLIQGDGGLVLVAGVVALVCVTFYFFHRSEQQQKIVRVLADEIRSANDPDLEENVLKAALHTPVEGEVYRLISRR
jgi:hypothetical protein